MLTQLKYKLGAYAKLTRFDRPVGIELLLWPTMWALFLASFGVNSELPSWRYAIIFTLGAVFMRAAGCAINDYADRHVDGGVARTKHRPLVTGAISAKEALAVFFVLVLASAALLLFLPVAVFYWSIGALALASFYPFTKRFTYLPQFFLGAAFSWAIPMAYVAVQGHPDRWCWLLYAANLCWTVAYDTQYAMTDRDDDLKIGIKSTAILFGKYDVVLVSLLHIMFLVLFSLVLYHYFDKASVIITLALSVLIFSQFLCYRTRKPALCLQTFLANVWVGRVAFALIVALMII